MEVILPPTGVKKRETSHRVNSKRIKSVKYKRNSFSSEESLPSVALRPPSSVLLLDADLEAQTVAGLTLRRLAGAGTVPSGTRRSGTRCG